MMGLSTTVESNEGRYHYSGSLWLVLCVYLKRGQDGVPPTRGRLISILCSIAMICWLVSNGVGLLPGAGWDTKYSRVKQSSVLFSSRNSQGIQREASIASRQTNQVTDCCRRQDELRFIGTEKYRYNTNQVGPPRPITSARDEEELKRRPIDAPQDRYRDERGGLKNQVKCLNSNSGSHGCCAT
jgi:hypothetical protein